jgi:hypothetical protein
MVLCCEECALRMGQYEPQQAFGSFDVLRASNASGVASRAITTRATRVA